MDNKRKSREESDQSEGDDKPDLKKESPFCNWSSSSSEHEFEDFVEPLQLTAKNLALNVTENDIKKLIKPVAKAKVTIYRIENKDGNLVEKQALIVFRSLKETKEAFKLKGEYVCGRPIYLGRFPKSRLTVCITGFSHELPEHVIREQISEKFEPCGMVMSIFLPTSRKTGFNLGFCYVNLDQSSLTETVALNSLKKLDSTMGGVEIQMFDVNLKARVNRAIMDGDVDFVLDKMEAAQPVNKVTAPLQQEENSEREEHEEIDLEKLTFSWSGVRPDLLSEAYTQAEHDCWAVMLRRGHFAALKKNNSCKNPLSVDMIKEGVDFRYQLSGNGIDNLKNSIPFMLKHVNDMKIHHRPKTSNEEDFEEYEKSIIRLLKEVPVGVTIDYLPSFRLFDGQGILCPTESDLYRKPLEKFPRHCLLLTGQGVEFVGKEKIEYWELHDSNGEEWGKEGFIKLARHNRLIKEVIEFKV